MVRVGAFLRGRGGGGELTCFGVDVQKVKKLENNKKRDLLLGEGEDRWVSGGVSE